MKQDTNDISTIRVSKKTKKRLKEIGRYSETADEILNQLIDYFEKNKKKK